MSSKNEVKNLRRWHPNMHRKRLYSASLDEFVALKVQARVLRTIDKCGGLDHYLLGNKARRVKELGVKGWELRWRVMQSGKGAALYTGAPEVRRASKGMKAWGRREAVRVVGLETGREAVAKKRGELVRRKKMNRGLDALRRTLPGPDRSRILRRVRVSRARRMAIEAVKLERRKGVDEADEKRLLARKDRVGHSVDVLARLAGSTKLEMKEQAKVYLDGQSGRFAFGSARGRRRLIRNSFRKQVDVRDALLEGESSKLLDQLHEKHGMGTMPPGWSVGQWNLLKDLVRKQNSAKKRALQRERKKEKVQEDAKKGEGTEDLMKGSDSGKVSWFGSVRQNLRQWLKFRKESK